MFDLLDNGAHIYFCGLKGMMPGAAAILALSQPPSCYFLCSAFALWASPSAQQDFLVFLAATYVSMKGQVLTDNCRC